MKAVALRVPCCRRAVRAAALMEHAPLVLKRTSPKCGARWQVVLTPLCPVLQGEGFVHCAEWLCLEGQK